MGITFKENVSDIRNSKVVDVVRELESYKLNVDIIDPVADKEEVKHEYNLNLSDSPIGVYDAIVIAVKHNNYNPVSDVFFTEHMAADGILIDLKGIYFGKKIRYEYWSL